MSAPVHVNVGCVARSDIMSLASKLEEAFSSNTVAPAVSVIIEERNSTSLIERLDEVASRELHKNEFKNVTLILRALEQVISKDEDCINQLVHQGLVMKMLNWFEMVCEYLKEKEKPAKAPVRLMEVFYEVSMRLCQSSVADSSKILQILTLRFGAVVIDKEAKSTLRLEAIKTINSMLDSASKETRKKLSLSDHSSLLEEFAKVIIEIGDYEIQVAITEALCRMTPKKVREEWAGRWFDFRRFASTFTTIRIKEFETDCRLFLNELNSYFGDSRRVYSYPCNEAFLDTTEMFKPDDELLLKFWIDFNVGTSSVGFFVNDPHETLWEHIHLPKDEVDEYSVHEYKDQKILSIQMLSPVSHGTVTGCTIRITFDSDYDILTAVEKVYGEEEKAKGLQTSKPAVIGEEDSGFHGTATESMQTFTSPSPLAAETPRKPKISFVLESGPSKHSPRKRRFPTEDTFCMKNESDTEVARAKSVIFGLSHSSDGSVCSVKSLPSSVRHEALQERNAKRFHSDSCLQSDELQFARNKSPVDYTKKKARPKGKLKVLPLSSPSSNDDYVKESTPKHGMKQSRVKGVDGLKAVGHLHSPKQRLEDSVSQDTSLLEDDVFMEEDEEAPVKDYTKEKKTPMTPRKRPPGSEDLYEDDVTAELKPEDRASLIKPRRLFVSNSDNITESSQAFTEAADSDAELHSGVMTAFNSFKAQLRKHFFNRYEKSEAKSVASLNRCQKTVTSLLSTVYHQRLIHLENFQNTVVEQLEHMEQNCHSLKDIEKETVGFWQVISDKVMDFCDTQQKRLDSLELMKPNDGATPKGTDATLCRDVDLKIPEPKTESGTKKKEERHKELETDPTIDFT